MLTFTQNAIKQLNKVLELEEHIRVAIVGGGCSGMTYTMDIDTACDDDDIIIELEAVRVYVDPVSAGILVSTTIDFVKTGLKEGFVFNNSKATTTCGCGSSFS